MATRTLKEYLDEIGACEDPARLTGELHVYDNWPVLFYGDQDELFSKVTRAFRDSPKKGGMGDSWSYGGEADGGRKQIFCYKPRTVYVQVARGTHDMWRYDADKIEGLAHSVWVMFHPYQPHQPHPSNGGRVEWDFRGMALAIAGFGEYVMQENLTIRLPRKGLELNYIPK